MYLYIYVYIHICTHLYTHIYIYTNWLGLAEPSQAWPGLAWSGLDQPTHVQYKNKQRNQTCFEINMVKIAAKRTNKQENQKLQTKPFTPTQGRGRWCQSLVFCVCLLSLL